MIRRIIFLLKPIALLVAIALTVAPRMAAKAETAEPLRIVLEATDVGYTCSEGCDVVDLSEGPWNPIIEVEQGQLVELTFVWAHRSYPYEEHIMVLEGYKLEWDKIDYDNREATLPFIADKPGAFIFKCDLKCDLHDYMQKGYLKVRPGGGTGAVAALTPTVLTLRADPSAWLAAGETVTLKALLSDEAGLPVSRAQIQFAVDAEFAGTRDRMEIGRATTGADGMASLSFRPTLALQEQNITARFEGMGLYAESQQALEVQVFGEPISLFPVAAGGLGGVGRIAQVTFLLTVLGIWMIFGYVLYQIYGITRTQEQ
jgi:hypothetical protein